MGRSSKPLWRPTQWVSERRLWPRPGSCWRPDSVSRRRAGCKQFADEFRLTEIPFGALHRREAVVAYARYGKGRHDAGLNFGDCLTYAVGALGRTAASLRGISLELLAHRPGVAALDASVRTPLRSISST